MYENLNKNLKLASTFMGSLLFLSTASFQIVGSSVYKTPFAINAVVASKEFERLKSQYGKDTRLTNTQEYRLIIKFYQDKCNGKLIAKPQADANGTITGYTYQYYSPISGDGLLFGNNYSYGSWVSYDSQYKEDLKEQWKDEGTLQDSEAVHQFVKDWKKRYITKKTHKKEEPKKEEPKKEEPKKEEPKKEEPKKEEPKKEEPKKEEPVSI